MSAAGRFFIGPHAVEQYQARCGRNGLSYETALAEMIAIGARAYYSRPAKDGCEMWRTGRPGRWRIIVDPRPHPGGPLPQIVTILPEHDRLIPGWKPKPGPLRITAHLRAPIALPDEPKAIDALLIWAVCQRENIPSPAAVDEVRDVEIPIAKEPAGRFHLASFSLPPHVLGRDRTWVNRRPPIEQYQAIGGPKIRRINLSGGPNKSYRLPLELGHVRELTWYVVGRAVEIEALLATIWYLGKKRSVGFGAVERWDVTSCETWDGFPVVRDGRALRPLPPDWPGLVDPVLAYRTLSPPYWMRERSVLVATPEIG